ncbi:MAG: transcription-repair coupling factor [Acidobacteriota bacterium]
MSETTKLERPAPFAAAATALRASEPFRRLRERLGDVVRLPVPAAAWVAAELAADLGRPLLVLVPHEVDAYAWVEASRLFGFPACYFPAPSLSPYQETEPSLLVRAEEARALDRIARGASQVVVTTPRALFRRLPSARDIVGARLEIAVDEEIPLDDLIDHLLRWGYHRSDLVFEVGQLAVRGGVFDVYPPGSAMPIRLDLFGDTVESIRRFDPQTQRSQGSQQTVELLPLSLFSQGPERAERLATLLQRMATDGAERRPSADVAEHLAALRDEGRFDGWQHYLPLLEEHTIRLDELLEAPLVVAVDPGALADEVERHAEILAAELGDRVEDGRLAVPAEALEHPAHAVRDVLSGAAVRLGDLFAASSDARVVDFEAQSTDVLHDQMPRFPREVETAGARGDRAVLVAPEDHRDKLAELLAAREVPLALAGDRGGLEIVGGDLQRGFRLPAAKLSVWSERQLLRRSPIVKRASKSRRFGPFLSSIRDLKIGDYIVHHEHGIGQFVGLRTLGGDSKTAELPAVLREAAPAQANDIEVMELSYAGGKNLLLPLSRLDQVQKYSGIEGVAPRLDRLGGTSWTKTKNRIKRGMRDMAQELLKLYAERQMAQAPQIDGGGEMQQRFEAQFAYDETPDQLDAIRAIYDDLAKAQPMDRLLCGDVGFGKTEVAMRAALRAVEGGYQVAVLAPTTILADQHYERFCERFDGLPVQIEMMSRFRSNAEVKVIQERAEAGTLDILIGTHRLLARKVQFPTLGLVIIDEEQRFGVAHKERLKQMRKDVHALAMSATPVPRTLQLSLAGVRDLSLIETPPRDRMAVETAILPFDPRLVREAVEFELERGGQVYYVYNRVETIDEFAAYLREVVPGVKVTVGHGQLDEKELSRRMHAFTAGEYDVLLATTIIENGIDIPNVNTMLVHQAERFGLSQLYQLRGRVGRSDQLAYCYLLVAADRILSEDARKRLDAIREFTELGSGFRVAGRDLEIRGAGNLLGAEQSGHIAAVGIETYLKMLEETVAELRGESVPEQVSVTLDLPVQMSIPEDYVGDANLRMEIYQRLASGEEPEDELLAELRDRFGAPPEGVRMLLRVASLQRAAEAMRLQSISARRQKLVLRLRQDALIEPEKLIELVQARPGYHFSPAGALTVEGVPGHEAIDRARELLDYLAAAPTAA